MTYALQSPPVLFRGFWQENMEHDWMRRDGRECK